VNVGGSVIYTYTITNTSAASTDPITLTSISDDKVGDLLDHAITANGGSATLAPGDSVTWTETVAMPSSGNAFANTVTVNSHDDEATSANDEASASVNLTFTISGVVFRDSIMNGTHDASEQKLANWTIYLYKETNGVAGYQTGSGGDQRVATAVSDSNGSYSFAGLLAGSYYTRGAVNSGWTQTAGDMNITNPTCENLTDNFGYLELKTTGRARGIGYWGGTQGKSVITYSGTDNDITFLNALNLVDDKGARVTWANTSAGLAAFQTWLNNSAKAKNMAYMLSAQLAAMQLNVRHGYASASTYVSIGSIALVGANLGAGDFIGGTYQTHNGNIYVSIQDLMDSANASLGDQALTLAGNSYRSRQEALKNILEVLNSDRAYYLM
jgi:hypothetical protein